MLSRVLRPRLFLNNFAISQFSTSSSRRVRFCDDAEEALKDVQNGATIFTGGFLAVGIPENSFRALLKMGQKDLTLIDVIAGMDGGIGIANLISNRQVKKVITSHFGVNKDLANKFFKGEIEVELVPQGTLAERIRAAGAGIPAFFTATGYGTLVHKGGMPLKFSKDGKVEKVSKPREARSINGRNYILEEALSADFALVKAWKADRAGNLVFRKSARNINPVIAKSAKVTIAEVEEIVETGQLDPDEIHVPHIYVDRVFKGKHFEKKIAFLKLLSTEKKAKTPDDLKRERIARRAVLELKDGMCVNLGVGIPIQTANFIKPGVTVHFHGEIGILGVGPNPTKEQLDPDLCNAGAETATIKKGGSFFPSDETFAMIRGGHIDWTILGGMQVSQYGDLANWAVTDKAVRGIGGAMDLVGAAGSKVMVTMEHSEKTGKPKILKDCTMPLTGKGVVNMIVTEMGVFEVSPRNGLTLVEIADKVTLDQVKAATGCDFKVSGNLKVMAQAD